ncbi:MAG: hypothetical protein ACI3W5_14265 [Faecousia sp.]
MEVFDPKFDSKTPIGEMNFVGAVRAYFDLFTQNCNQDTKDTYIRDYNERIFPLIKPSLAIKDYTEETIEFYRVQLQKLHHYDDATIRSRYDHLLSDPCEVYFETLGIRNNPFWGAGFKFCESEEETKQEKLLKIRKSLTIQEELRAKDYLLKSPGTDDGVLVGLAIMFLAALRNAEACGLNFGDLIEFEFHAGRYYLRVYETTGADSNVLKLGGKTYNAPRYVPIPKVLSDFLLRRKEYIQSEVAFPLVDKDGKVYESVEMLPIVCRKNHFSVRCGTKDLSDAGRNLLRYQLKMSEEQVSGINVIIREELDDLGEKEPTAYLFRRNMATHLYSLGFSQFQIQYYMGHRLENTDLKRSDFTDEELLYEMSVLLDAHPLNENRRPCSTLTNLTVREAWENVPEVEIKINPQDQVKRYYLKVINRELNDPLKFSISGQDCSIELHSTADGSKQSSGVNITKQINAAYSNEKTPR